jgi:hypothetical protein
VRNGIYSDINRCHKEREPSFVVKEVFCALIRMLVTWVCTIPQNYNP